MKDVWRDWRAAWQSHWRRCLWGSTGSDRWSPEDSVGRRTYYELFQECFEEGIVFGKILEYLIVMTAEIDEDGKGIFGDGLYGQESAL